MQIKRVACIGTGNIAETHAAVLKRIPGVDLVAAVDPNAKALASFAKRWGIAKGFADVDALISERVADVAHVLVPPPLHKPIAVKLLAAGINVFLEKPMAQSSEECEVLQVAAAGSGAKLRINHNFVHHPSHCAAKALIAANRIGPVRHVIVRYGMPLRQLGAGQLGHWMFDSPLNLLLEQAVHPLSQICDLVGAVREISALPSPPLTLGEGREVWRKWQISLACERGTAQLYISLGDPHSNWAATIIGDDGVIQADYARARVAIETSGRYGDFFDDLRNGLTMAGALATRSFGNAASYVFSTLKLLPRSDPFFLSMSGSISAFYRDLEKSTGDMSGLDGRRLVELCEHIARFAKPAVKPSSQSNASASYDVLVIGGTGFIGSHLVGRLVKQGIRVGVLARNLNNLPGQFHHASVALVRGDARNADDVAQAIGNATIVINLAHGGGGGSREEVEANLVGAARTVAECCARKHVKRLIYVSTIASLYLGDAQDVVVGASSPDIRPDSRGDYSRAKILSEREMIRYYRERNLPVTILRPGIVIGQGTSPFHSGIGFYNHEAHCMGWNAGRNPLPLVLVEDVADAIISAMNASGVDGKSYNLVGEVRLTAREYIAELAAALDRPLRYHPQSVHKLYAIELLKAAVKRATGRRDPLPSLRDLKSRGLAARFDCEDAHRDLDWHPVRDRAEFVRKGFPQNGGA
ncbi:MAG TPA: NAD-dependent epimerase/dehydratase family protein [Rhizomicrobium sp.]|nr:NAD-dependent epimerase/dehydratase family protein [Rhizomicrobium sp.]